MFGGNVLQTLSGIVNAAWVGHGIGDSALAAVTVSMPVIFMLVALAIGLTMAANILGAQAYGAKDTEYLKRVVGNSVVVTLAVSSVCVALGYFLAEPVLVAMQTDPKVLPMAISYMRIVIWTIPPMFGMFLMASLLRGTGDSKTPLYFQSLLIISNAVLDPILMFGWLGAPKLGLNGTAVASIIAATGALIALVAHLRAKRHIVLPDWIHLRFDWHTSWLLFRVGFWSGLQQAIISLGLVVITGLVNTFGEKSTAAFGVAMRIDNLAFMPAMTVGMAVSALAGQNIGAQRYDRVQQVFKWGILLGCGITSLGTIVMVSMPWLLLKIFTKDPMVISIGTNYLRIVGPAYVILAVLFVGNGVINGAGHTFITMVISLFALWGIRVPLATYLARHTHHIEGIWWSMAVGFAAGALISVAYYWSGRWKGPLRGGATQPAAALDTVPIPEALPE